MPDYANVDYQSEELICTSISVRVAGDDSWVNTSNLTADDGNKASIDLAAQSPIRVGETLEITGFSWSFTDEAHIDAVVMKLDDIIADDPTNASIYFYYIDHNDLISHYSLVSFGFGYTPNQEVYMPSPSASDETNPCTNLAHSYSDAPTLNFAAANLKDADFGFAFRIDGEISAAQGLDVDFAGVNVYYHYGFPARLTVFPQHRTFHRDRFFRYNNETYAVVYGGYFDSGSSERIRLLVRKAADPSKGNWTNVDESNGPNWTGGSPGIAYNDDHLILDHCIVGNTLHIVYSYAANTGSNDLYHSSVNLDTGTWGTQNTLETGIDTSYGRAAYATIEAWGASNIMIAYTGHRDKIMGGDKGRVDYAYWNGTSWSAANALDAAGDIHYGSPNMCKASTTNEYHFTWFRETSTASDPNTTWSDLQGRTWESGSLNGTTNTQALPASITSYPINARRLIFKSATEIVLFYDNGSGQQVAWNCQETGANDIIAFDTSANGTSSFTETPKQAQWSIVYDATNDRWYRIWIGNSVGRGPVMLATSKDDGATWSSEEAYIPEAPTDFSSNDQGFSANLLDSPTGPVIGFAIGWVSGRILDYWEYPLNPILPYHTKVNDARKRNTLLRM